MVEKQPSAEHQQSAATEGPDATIVSESPKPETANKSTQKRQREPRDWYDYVSLLITLLGLVGLWYYAYWAKVQGLETSRAAKAAKRSADSESASVRAWLVITHTDTEVEQINNTPPDPVIPVAVIHFQNAGKTPATDIIGRVEFKVSQYGTQPPKFPHCPAHVARRDAVVNAGAESEVWVVPDSLTRRERKLVDSGQAALYTHGCITYHDVLGPGETRLSEFVGFVTGAWGNRNGRTVIVRNARWEVFTVTTK